jgi:hypothetical protein
MSLQEDEDAKIVTDLQKLARYVDSQLPYGWGFAVLAFPFGQGGRMNYISNSERNDIVRAMYEFIESSKERFGEHVADPSADDEPLGRARQELAQIKRLCARAADALEAGWPTDGELERDDIKLIAQLREAGK